MINRLNINHKVSRIIIKMTEKNPISTDIIRLIKNRYHNMYDISLGDGNSQINTNIH